MHHSCTYHPVYIITNIGSGQTPPENCVHTFRIEKNHADITIIPGVINCFSCALDTMSNVLWVNSSRIPLMSEAVQTNGNFLVIEMPDNYVQPGPSGMRHIACLSIVFGQTLNATLASPGNQSIIVFHYYEGDIIEYYQLSISPDPVSISQCYS